MLLKLNFHIVYFFEFHVSVNVLVIEDGWFVQGLGARSKADDVFMNFWKYIVLELGILIEISRKKKRKITRYLKYIYIYLKININNSK